MLAHLCVVVTSLTASTLIAGAALRADSAPPPTETKPVTDVYHGVSVVDDYRWLEDWNESKVKSWSDAQNEYARGVLDALPGVDAIRARVTEIYTAQSESYSGVTFAGNITLAMKRQPPKQQPFLVVLEGGVAKEGESQRVRVLVDPNEIDKDGGASIDWYIPSHDGKLVAVSISRGGSESGDVSVFDITSGKQVGEIVPRVNGGTAGGSLAWSKDNKGFYYSRYPRGGERPSEDMDFYTQVYYHEVNTPTSSDRYELGKAQPRAFAAESDAKQPSKPDVSKLLYGRTTPFEFTRIAEIMLAVDESSGRVLCSVQHGDGGTFAFYLRDTDGTWHLVADYQDTVVQAAMGPRGSVYLVSRKDAPKGKVMLVSAQEAIKGISAASVIIPEGKDSIVNDFFAPDVFTCAANALVVTYQLGGPAEIRVFDHAGKPAASPKQFDIGDVWGVSPDSTGKIYFCAASYIRPATWFAFDPSTGKTSATGLVVKAPVNFDDCEVVREFATSKDGTKVPVNIIRKRGLMLDGSHPAILTGYGGYGVNIQPAFRPGIRVLIDHGFVWAEANIRGGGEYGDSWHRQGSLVNKQNVFDDFAAAMGHLIERKYTSSQRLAIEGGSNGGLLMGAMITQHPKLFATAVSHVGIYDMLRVELSSNGAFNIPEFGTVTDEAQFKALYAYSPYQAVKSNISYPPVLFLTGANDPRVDPMQSRKMTARLQSVGATALLRTSSNSGHGAGTSLSERIEQAVDVNAWLFHKLQVK